MVAPKYVGCPQNFVSRLLWNFTRFTHCVSGGIVTGGNTRVNSDVPPFFLYSGFDVEAKGLNLVGLKRAGYKASDVAVLKKAYRILYRSGLKLAVALARIETEIPTPETLHLVSFIRRSERGICRE